MNNRSTTAFKPDHTCSFCFLNVTVSVSTDTPLVLETFKGMYQRFLSADIAVPDITCWIFAKNGNGSDPYVIINKEKQTLFEGDLFISHAHMMFFKSVVEHITDYLLMHAGVVSKNGRGFILSGPSSFGKTTLILELVSRGYKFLSDEFCAADLSDFMIEPFPRSLGLRKNSPFLSRMDSNRCMELKNIGRGTKMLVQCDDIFKKSIGGKCRADTLIILKRSLAQESEGGRRHIDLALFSRNQALLEELLGQQGVELFDTFIESDYIVYRFSLDPEQKSVTSFKNVCKRYENEIFYQEQIQTENPDFDAEPVLKPIKKSDAALEMLKNLRNRSPDSMLFEKFCRKNTGLMLKVGEFVRDVNCYEMKIGRLEKMAEIIKHI